MKFTVLSMAALFSSCAWASSYSIEDAGFTPASRELSKQIESDGSFKPFAIAKCSLQQETIAAVENEKLTNSLIFLTTANQCGWGTSLGPIWIVLNEKNSYQQVLYSGGYSVEMLPAITNGLHNIKIKNETAGVASSKSYQFTGREYRAY